MITLTTASHVPSATIQLTRIGHRAPAVESTPVDPIEQMRLDDRADWALLRLVLCAAIATLALAAAASTMTV